MATVDFAVTRDQVITDALELLGVLEAGETAVAADVTSSAFTLNMMIKAWQIDGIDVFSVKRAYLFPIKNTSEFTLSSSGNHYTFSYVKDTINGALASGVSAIVVDDATSIAASDYVGIYQDDGTMHWTTVASVATKTVNLDDVTTDEISDGATLYYYTTKADAPEEILEASLKDNSLQERPLGIISRKEWNELSNKTSDGKISQIYFDDRVTDPSLFIWPQTSDTRDVVLMWIKRTRSDFDASTDNPDLPQRWYFPLVYNLAVAIGPKFGTPSNNKNFKEIKDQAVYWYERAQDYDSRPEANVQMQPDL